MKAAVYLGSSLGTHPVFKEKTKQLGRLLAENQVELVYGGGATGLMGILADSVKENGGIVIGVMPQFMISEEKKYENCDTFCITDTMSERKTKMIELSDAYIAMPGGVGTLEEISEVISQLRLGMHKHPCIFCNIDHYYDPMKLMLNQMADAGFLDSSELKLVFFTDDIDEILEIIKGNKKE